MTRGDRVRSMASGRGGVVIADPDPAALFEVVGVLSWSGEQFVTPVEWTERLEPPRPSTYGRWTVRRVPRPQLAHQGVGRVIRWGWVWSASSPYTFDGFPVIHYGDTRESVMAAIARDEEDGAPWTTGVSAASAVLRRRPAAVVD